ncbi:hypothetical protein HD554DRAFT_2039909 [Boletus coccyginus]|nr:hypothetical protein HD554DRAFT_2039909 [Boletus coccyginus]
MAEWKNMASTKLDVLAKIVHHHLQQENALPLKISNNGSALYDIKTIELNGKILHNKCKSVLNEFKLSTHHADAQVLILSMVDAVGLNLACSNIMIIAEHTLISPTKADSLLSPGSPDIFLNNLAFDKGKLYCAFVDMDDQTVKLFNSDDTTLDLAHSADSV